MLIKKKTRIYAAPAVKGLTLTTLRYFSINRKGFFHLFITNILGLSASFEYLYYGYSRYNTKNQCGDRL